MVMMRESTLGSMVGGENKLLIEKERELPAVRPEGRILLMVTIFTDPVQVIVCSTFLIMINLPQLLSIGLLPTEVGYAMMKFIYSNEGKLGIIL